MKAKPRVFLDVWQSWSFLCFHLKWSICCFVRRLFKTKPTPSRMKAKLCVFFWQLALLAISSFSFKTTPSLFHVKIFWNKAYTLTEEGYDRTTSGRGSSTGSTWAILDEARTQSTYISTISYIEVHVKVITTLVHVLILQRRFEAKITLQRINQSLRKRFLSTVRIFSLP
jgi:hypothetical protein